MKNLFLFLLVFMSATSFAIDWQGHRGARGLYPENTIGSMKEALKFPVTTLELDVVISQDKQVVVSHEPYMNPTICSHPEGKTYEEKEINLFKIDYSEIVKFDCGSLVHPKFPNQIKVNVGKPLLSVLLKELEVELKDLNRQNVTYNIEIKSSPELEKKGFQPKYIEFTDLVVKVIKDHLPLERVVVQSFDWRVLKYLHDKYPDITLSALTDTKMTTKEVLKELGFFPRIFSPYYKKLPILSEFKQSGMKVIPWTVNSVPEMKELLNLGVDGIITDYPNLILQATSKDCPEKSHLFEGKCVEVPTHAGPTDKNPGWVCKAGHIQKRKRCVKINLPPNSHLESNGKTWICDEGFERYRGTCRKSK